MITTAWKYSYCFSPQGWHDLVSHHTQYNVIRAKLHKFPKVKLFEPIFILPNNLRGSSQTQPANVVAPLKQRKKTLCVYICLSTSIYLSYLIWIQAKSNVSRSRYQIYFISRLLSILLVNSFILHILGSDCVLIVFFIFYSLGSFDILEGF
jgi:hypothetical protein